jgi:hypothetical protein
MAFNINTPLSIEHMFGNWLNGIEKLEKVKIRVGVCVLCSQLYGMCIMTLSLTNHVSHYSSCL